MSVARSNFESRISTLRDSLGDPALADGPPTTIQKNAVAGMLRNGLAVLAFAITEDFIRDRTAEILKGFSAATVKFDDLSEDLQQAVTLAALSGILYRANYQEKTDRVSWVLSELTPVLRAKTDVTHLSAYSFGQSTSNIGQDVPSNILSAFGVAGGWTTIGSTAKRIGLGGVLDYAQGFKDIANRRHLAAHNAATKIPLDDLANSIKTILGICCSFDLLISHALAIHNKGTIPHKKNSPVSDKNLTFKFISPHPAKTGKYRLQVETSDRSALRTVKVCASLSDARIKAAEITNPRNAYLVLLRSDGIPESWETD